MKTLRESSEHYREACLQILNERRELTGIVIGTLLRAHRAVFALHVGPLLIASHVTLALRARSRQRIDHHCDSDQRRQLSGVDCDALL